MSSNDVHGTPLLSQWTSLDQAPRPDEFVQFLKNVDRISAVRTLREATYPLLGHAGSAGVDVGSGTGEVIHQLALRGIEGIGVDLSQTMVNTASLCFPDCRFVLGSAYELPFPDRHFDWYRAERVIHLLDHPDVALAEAHRVLKPGGRIVLLSPEAEATVFSTSVEHTELNRAAIAAMVEKRVKMRGTQIPQLMVEAGFKQIEIVPYALHFDNVTDARSGILDLALDAGLKTGALTFEDVHTLHDDMNKLTSNGSFICVMTLVLSSGRR